MVLLVREIATEKYCTELGVEVEDKIDEQKLAEDRL